jgi:hypothetical protein
MIVVLIFRHRGNLVEYAGAIHISRYVYIY